MLAHWFVCPYAQNSSCKEHQLHCERLQVVGLWRVSGHDVPVKAVVAKVEGSKKRFTLVTSAVELTGLQMVELFAARLRQEGRVP